MANQTATDYGVYPPRGVHTGTNFMHTNIVTTISASASDNLYMFPIPPDCMINFFAIKGSVPSGTIGNIVLKIGVPGNDTLISSGITLSGTAVLNSQLTIIAPITLSSSGTDALTPLVIAVNSAVTSTTSLSIYCRIGYMLPGNLN